MTALSSIAFLALALPSLSEGADLSDSQLRTQVISSYGKLPLQFEANAGQIGGMVKFVARGKDYSLFLTPDEAVLSLRRMKARSSKRAFDRRQRPSETEASAELRMRVVGADSHAAIHGEDALPGLVNYFIGNDHSKWRTGISTYAKVRYDGIYRGIDLIY